MGFIHIVIIVIIITITNGNIFVKKDFPFLEETNSMLGPLLLTKFKDGSHTYGNVQDCIMLLKTLDGATHNSIITYFHDTCSSSDEVNTDINAAKLVVFAKSKACAYLIKTGFNRKTDKPIIEVFNFKNQFMIEKTWLGFSSEVDDTNDISLKNLKIITEPFMTSYCIMRQNHRTAFNMGQTCLSNFNAKSGYTSVVRLTQCSKVKELPEFSLVGNHYSKDMFNSLVDLPNLQIKDCSELNKDLCGEENVEITRDIYEITYKDNQSDKRVETDSVHLQYLNPANDINTYMCQDIIKTYKHETYDFSYSRNENCSIINIENKDLTDCISGKCKGDSNFCRNFGCSGIIDLRCIFDDCSRQIYLASNRRLLSFKGINKHNKAIHGLKLPTGYEMINDGSKTEIECKKNELIINARGPIILEARICKLPYCLEIKPNTSAATIQLLRPMLLTSGIISTKLLFEGNTKFILYNTFCNRMNVCEFNFSYLSWSKWQVISCYTPLQWFIISLSLLLLAIFGRYLIIFSYWIISIFLVFIWPFLRYGYILLKKLYYYIQIKVNQVKNHIDIEVQETSKSKFKNLKSKKLDYAKQMTKISRSRVMPSWMSAKNRQYYDNSNSPGNYLVIICIFSLLMKMGDCCSKTSTLTVSNNKCETSETGIVTCSLVFSSRIAVSPVGQTSCFILENADGKSIGSIQLKTNNIRLSCKKNLLYYIPNPDVKCSSAFNCYKAGFCSGDYRECNNPSSWTKRIFGEISNKYWHRCQRIPPHADCLLNSGACMHTLVNIIPTGQVGYEVFNCAEWSYSASLTVTFLQLNDQQVSEVNLLPGAITDVNQMQFSLISLSIPPSPTFDKCFLKKGNLLTIVDCNKRGEYSIGRIGEIQCNTQEEAKSDLKNCIADEKLINIIINNGYLKCENKMLNIESYLSSNLLPITTGDYKVEKDDEIIPFIRISKNSLLEIQVDLNGKKLISNSDKNLCYASFKSLSGCYSCMIGAELSLEVNTNFGSATGIITCPEIGFSSPINIESTPTIKNLTFLSSTSHIDTDCSIKCPAGEKKFRMSGELYYVPNDDHHNNNTESGSIHDGSGIDWSGLFKIPAFKIFGIIILSILFIIIIILSFKTIYVILNSFKSKTS